MDNITLELGRELYRNRYGRNPQLRTLSYPVAAGIKVNVGNSNEIAMLIDVSEDDKDFTIESDTVYLQSSTYFRNSVPVIPHEMAGNIVIYNTSSDSITFTFYVFY